MKKGSESSVNQREGRPHMERAQQLQRAQGKRLLSQTEDHSVEETRDE